MTRLKKDIAVLYVAGEWDTIPEKTVVTHSIGLLRIRGIISRLSHPIICRCQPIQQQW
jgi:hypothetical protein